MTGEPEPVRAPALRGSAWLNVERPLTADDLRGKLVLLDFWTASCINCLHVLDDLKYLETKYAGRPFAVIGVHSPKFAHEDDPASLRQAIARHGITHPVVLDSGRRTWDAYAVRGWPTLVLIDPRGYILGQVSGEGHREQLDAAIGRALELYEAGGTRDNSPLPVRLETEAGAISPFSPLLFPGKVLADDSGDRLFIADTGHHRLICATLDGAAPVTIGAATPGATDGDYDGATFHSPQGMALDAAHDWLYVADTGNSLIRRVNLREQSVTTVAGTGAQGFTRAGSGPARAMPLNSPWDVCLVGDQLYIAMAGLHQIWVYDPHAETVAVFAGSGAEGRADGPAPQAALAQPSGLATDGAALFVADSEISAIRRIAPLAEPNVTTLAGGDLFQFGARDGRGDYARFQHPLGVAWVPAGAPGGGFVYVADTFNHELRRLDPQTRDVTTFAGATLGGAADGRAASVRFDEPGGVSYTAGALYVADTNNHAIRVVSLPGGETHTLELAGLCAPGLCLPG
ncbi:MAG: thioredoxin-like domain-containing protein [Ktedonobacterales bacterium]